MFGRTKGDQAVADHELPPAEPGTLIEGRHGRALVVEGEGWRHLEPVEYARDVAVGLNRDETARMGVEVVTRGGAKYLVVDGAVYSASRMSMPLPVRLWNTERGRPAMAGRPWWAHLVPRVVSTVELLDAADESTPPPWADAMATDVALVGLRAEYDRLAAEALDGNYAAGNEVRVRTEAIELLHTIRRREQFVRGVWIEEHATGPTPESLAGYEAMYLAAWWLTRDGTVGEVRLYEEAAVAAYPEARRWRAPASVLRETTEWLTSNGFDLPAVPADLPAKPTTLGDALAARTTTGATDA